MANDLPTSPLPSKNLSARRIDALARLFAVKCAEDKGLPFRPFSPQALAVLAAYDWKDDLSAFEATVRHAVIMADGDEIAAEAVRLPTQTSDAVGPVEDETQEVSIHILLGRTISDIERVMILTTLKYSRGSRTRAADVLDISVRTLRNKLNRYARYGMAIGQSETAKSSRSPETSHGQATRESGGPLRQRTVP